MFAKFGRRREKGDSNTTYQLWFPLRGELDLDMRACLDAGTDFVDVPGISRPGFVERRETKTLNQHYVRKSPSLESFGHLAARQHAWGLGRSRVHTPVE